MRVAQWGGSGGWKYAAGEVLLIVVGILRGCGFGLAEQASRQANRAYYPPVIEHRLVR